MTPTNINPLLESHELPPFKAISAEQIAPAIDEILNDNKKKVNDLLKTIEVPSWANLLGALEALDDRLNQVFSPLSHLNAVVNTPDLRDAYNAILPKLSEYQTEMGQNAALFAAYASIASSEEFAALNVAQQKTIENTLRDFKLSGIDLNSDDQKRFADIQKRLAELSSSFNDNVLDATMAWSKCLTDVSDLEGLPETALAQAKQFAAQKGKEGYLLTLDMPSYLPIMTYCSKQGLRKEIYEAFTTRASDQGPHAGQWDNAENIREILVLRKQCAELLGFSNAAESSLATKMAQNTDQVVEFLTELAERSKPVAEKEFTELCAFAAEHYGVEEINAWDIAYYSEKLKALKFDISDEILRPYFPAPGVLLGMFELVRRLYGIDVEVDQNMETWHEDVTTYLIRRNGKAIARFYLDLYARENKRGGAWMDECRVRRIKADGELQLPVAYLACNFSGPLGDAPALLTHNEVVTLFHEFGHGLHHMMTKIDCASVSGINGVAWDAIELPSQFMENWCWQAEALVFISGHFETGEPLPAELLEKMLAAKSFHAGLTMMQQLEFSLFDFCLHIEFDPSKEEQVQEILNQVRAEVSVIQTPPFNRFQNGFSHIFGGGYAAGYYSYKWAEVLSADAFSQFEEDGIFNRQTGEKFLSCILEQGGSVDAMDMFVAFRGREPNIEALLRQDGII